MLIFGESLTYENARYVLRDLGQILSEDSSEPAQSIAFDSDGDMDYAIFRGSLVVCGVSGVDIYSPSGTLKLNDNTVFTSPTVVTSEKYCIVYSQSAYNLSVYNTVARVWDMKFDYPIYDVAVSDNGSIAVMTQSIEYKCVVYYYYSDFHPVATYNKNSHPVAVDFNGENLNIVTFGTKNGSFVTKYESYGLLSDTPSVSLDIEDLMPYDVSSTENGNSVIASRNGLAVISSDGSITSRIDYPEPIIGYSLSEEYLTVLSSHEKSKKISVYTQDGEIHSSRDEDDAAKAYSFDGRIFVQKKNSLLIVSADGSESLFELEGGAEKLLYNDGFVYACYLDKIISFKVS
jgi:hypothetical protein